MIEIADGWSFFKADFSIKSFSNPLANGKAFLVRDCIGKKRWLNLTEEEQKYIPLYVFGEGYTLEIAIGEANFKAERLPKLY